MKGFYDRVAARVARTGTAVSLCFALGACGVSNKITSAFEQPLNVSAPIQTSPGNFTVSADDASAAVANAAALQQASAACATFGLRSRTVDSSASVTAGRHYFILNFQCQ